MNEQICLGLQNFGDTMKVFKTNEEWCFFVNIPDQQLTGSYSQE